MPSTMKYGSAYYKSLPLHFWQIVVALCPLQQLSFEVLSLCWKCTAVCLAASAVVFSVILASHHHQLLPETHRPMPVIRLITCSSAAFDNLCSNQVKSEKDWQNDSHALLGCFFPWTLVCFCALRCRMWSRCSLLFLTAVNLALLPPSFRPVRPRPVMFSYPCWPGLLHVCHVFSWQLCLGQTHCRTVQTHRDCPRHCQLL